MSIYLDNATRVLRESIFSPRGERCSSYGIFNKAHVLFEEYDAKLRALFHLGSQDIYGVTACFEDIPKRIIQESGCKKIVVSLTDSAAILSACDKSRGKGVDVTYLRGEKPSVADKETLLFFQYVHPLTGCIQEEYKNCMCRLAIDISYAIGKVALDDVLERADYLIIRGDALGVPYGLSLVIARRGSFLEESEFSVEVLEVLVKVIEETFEKELFFMTECARWRAIFEEPFSSHVFAKEEERAPHISCILFPKIKNESLLFMLHRRKVFATIGGGPFLLLERILPLYGVSYVDAMTALSFCFGSDSTESGVREASLRLRRACQELQMLF